MILENKEWYYSQTLRSTLGGFSQEEIARQLQVSEGTINAIMQDLMNSDDTLRLQHEIAIVSKKSGVPIKHLASTLAFANAIKLRALQADKIEATIRAIDSFCVHEGSYDPDAIAPLFIEFCDLVIKNRISPSSLNNILKSKYDEHYKLVQQVEQEKVNLSQIKEESKSELERNNITTKTLHDFSNLKEDFEFVGLDFDQKDEVRNVLYNIAMMDNNSEEILDQMKQTRFLNLHRSELLSQCEQIEETIQFFKREQENLRSKISLYALAVEVINEILQRGYNSQDILKIFYIYSKHQDLSLDQFASDIDTYGGIRGAISKASMDYIRNNLAIQNLTPYRANTDISYNVNINQSQRPQ
jgi:transcriptional regulator with XRE-family HTH domain